MSHFGQSIPSVFKCFSSSHSGSLHKISCSMITLAVFTPPSFYDLHFPSSQMRSAPDSLPRVLWRHPVIKRVVCQVTNPLNLLLFPVSMHSWLTPPLSSPPSLSSCVLQSKLFLQSCTSLSALQIRHCLLMDSFPVHRLNAKWQFSLCVFACLLSFTLIWHIIGDYYCTGWII